MNKFFKTIVNHNKEYTAETVPNLPAAEAELASAIKEHEVLAMQSHEVKIAMGLDRSKVIDKQQPEIEDNLDIEL